MLGKILMAEMLNGNEKNGFFSNILHLRILTYALYGSKFISEVYSCNSYFFLFFHILCAAMNIVTMKLGCI